MDLFIFYDKKRKTFRQVAFRVKGEEMKPFFRWGRKRKSGRQGIKGGKSRIPTESGLRNCYFKNLFRGGNDNFRNRHGRIFRKCDTQTSALREHKI